MAVPGGHQEPPLPLSLSEKVPQLFFPRSARRIGAGHVARPEGQEKIVVEESDATPAGWLLPPSVNPPIRIKNGRCELSLLHGNFRQRQRGIG